MARNNGPLIPDEDIATRPGSQASSAADDSALDARFLDLDADEQTPFLRGQKRVPVRRGPLPKKAASRIKIAAIVLAIAAAIGGVSAVVYNYGTGSWRFRLESSDQIGIQGLENVSRRQVMEVVGSDIGRNVFFIPLEERKHQLEEIPWVESANVSRSAAEPVADFHPGTDADGVCAEWAPRFALIDSHGVVMEMPSKGAKAIFVSGVSRHGRIGATVDARGADEYLLATGAGTRCGRRAQSREI